MLTACQELWPHITQCTGKGDSIRHAADQAGAHGDLLYHAAHQRCTAACAPKHPQPPEGQSHARVHVYGHEATQDWRAVNEACVLLVSATWKAASECAWLADDLVDC